MLDFFDKKMLLLLDSNTSKKEIYEFIIDTTNSDPTTAVSYTGANASYTPASMDFSTGAIDYGSWANSFFVKNIRPVMLKYDGTVDYELSKNDFTKKADGVTASDVSNTSYGGNCMIGFPQIWMKFAQDDSTHQHVYIASEQIDDSYHCYTHYNNNGVLLNEIYTAAFEPSNISSKLRSLADQTVCTNTVGTTMRTYAQNNGNGWDFLDMGTIQMIQMLFILMFKSRDSQTKCGGGVVGGTQMTSTGSLKDKPMFYSTNNTSSSNVAVKFFGMENLWGNYWKWINGLCSRGNLISYKLCNYTADGSTVIGYDPTAPSGYLTYSTSSALKTFYNLGMPNTNAGLMWYWPTSGLQPTAGSSTTYYCDRVKCQNMTNTFPACGCYGGAYNNGADAGLFFADIDFSRGITSTSKYSYIGASLSCKPF